MILSGKLIMKTIKIILFVSVLSIAGCAVSPDRGYKHLTLDSAQCKNIIYNDAGTIVCIQKENPPYQSNLGQNASDVAASVIISAIEQGSTIDADAPFYDDIVMTVQKYIRDTGAAWVYLDYGHPKLYKMTVLNFPDERLLVLHVRSSENVSEFISKVAKIYY
jgi:hypothetical protein